MKNKVRFPYQTSLFVNLLLLIAMAFSLATQPTRAAPQGTYINGHITKDTTWTSEGNPYEVYIEMIVDPGVTLTINPGVMVKNFSGVSGSTSYSFTVEGTLIANGTLSMPIYFDPGSTGWSGINIIGQPNDINTGSSLN